MLNFVIQNMMIVNSVQIDILSDKVINILRELESLKLIRLHNNLTATSDARIKIKKMKGTMSKANLNEIDRQLNQLREEWD